MCLVIVHVVAGTRRATLPQGPKNFPLLRSFINRPVRERAHRNLTCQYQPPEHITNSQTAQSDSVTLS